MDTYLVDKTIYTFLQSFPTETLIGFTEINDKIVTYTVKPMDTIHNINFIFKYET